MNVQSYQMHNVLNVYSKQLSQNMNGEKNKKAAKKPPADQVNVTAAGKRLATLKIVSKDIFDKITRFGSPSDTSRGITEHTDGKTDKEAASGKTNKTTFVFNVIDTINKKRTNTLSIEDASFLIQRLEQLSKEALDKKPESWI